MPIFSTTLPESTARALSLIKNIPYLKNFYLSGGTALSLQIGHRESEDLDFFSQQQFEPQLLLNELIKISPTKNTYIDNGTLNTYLENVKLQFLLYPYELLENPIVWNGLLLSSISDVACTKLITISDRGSKKDFVDLYFILRNTSLKELFGNLEKKYNNVNYNKLHILKSLVYFENAETQPMPRMHDKTTWEEIKNSVVEKVKAFTLLPDTMG